ncbi:MAG: ADP/ATP-dependent (S)-NAD(P)H-hydrate dehydratase, partial [Acidimicrobiales bacterium]
GRSDEVLSQVRQLVANSPVPVVVDADALGAFADPAVLADAPIARAPLVLTPHEGEFARLSGSRPGSDRISAVVALAVRTGATVLLKGSTTVVASPAGGVLVSTSGSPRLATAGSGDVLAGVIAAFLAQGLVPLEAAALAAHAHGASAALGFSRGLAAGDLPELLAAWLSGLDSRERRALRGHTPRKSGPMSSQNRGGGW